MKKANLFLILFFSLQLGFSHIPADWGKTGHRATAEIAEQFLKGRAKRKIKKILAGERLASVSTFADEIKSDPRYKAFSPWHYANIPDGKTYAQSKKNPQGDLVTAIKTCIQKLKNPDTPPEEEGFYLKLLIHFIGDLHQPLHFGRKDDKGGNDFKVKWFTKSSNLHRVWDSEMIDHYKMSYSELALNRKKITKDEVKKIQSGTLLDWTNESHTLAIKIYDSAEKGDNLMWNYMYDWFSVVREQIQKGGIRLAKILNDIYG